MKNLVSTSWLSAHLSDQELIVLDCRLAKPKNKADDEKLRDHFIPGALSFDLETDFSDTETDLPHMLANATKFSASACKLGINPKSKIVVYDQFGIYSSPRVWWMFKAMGHENVAVLDGGLPAWIANGFDTTNKLSQPKVKGNFSAELSPNWVSTASEVLEQSENNVHAIIDARSTGRFFGTEPEPRAGLRGGHIPNSLNLPFPEVLDNGKYKSPEELKGIFQKLGVDNQPLTMTCGSGVTASIIALAACLAGFEKLSVYDGSWSEWGQLDDYSVSKK